MTFPLLPLSLAFESSPCVERWRPAISTVTLWMESPKDFSRRTTERWTTVAFDSASRRSSLKKEREKGGKDVENAVRIILTIRKTIFEF